MGEFSRRDNRAIHAEDAAKNRVARERGFATLQSEIDSIARPFGRRFENPAGLIDKTARNEP
jgi:hypothetical protein